MSQQKRPNRRKAAWAAVGFSVLVHLVILVVFLPPKLAEWTAPNPPDENEEFEVTTTIEEQEEPVEQAQAEPDELVETEEQETVEPDEQQEEPPEEEEEEELREPDIDVDRKVVEQETNEEDPEEADYLSDQANKVDEQTRAEETTTENVLPGKDVPEELEEPGGSQDDEREGEEMAARSEVSEQKRPEEQARRETASPKPEKERAPSEEAEPEAEEGATQARERAEDSPVVRKKPGKVSPRALFDPSANDYEEVFGETDERLKGQVKEEKRGRKLLSGWKDREKAVRASLENHITEVKPGNHTGVNAKAAVYASYISRIHRKIHQRWGATYLPHLDSNMPRGHPLNNPRLNSKLEFVIDAESGSVDAVNIVDSSGEMMFDAEAVAISHAIGPHRSPPGEIVSPDGKVYIHWNFWRDQRQCGPFGASVFIVNNEQKDRGGRGSANEVRGGGR